MVIAARALHGETEKAWNIALGAISIPHAQSLKVSFKPYRPKLYCYPIDSNLKLQPDGSIRLRALPQKGKVSISTSFFKDLRAVLADFHDSNVVRMIHV